MRAKQSINVRARAATVWQEARRFTTSRKEGIQGVAAIEFALVLSFLFIMVLCVIDIGVGLYRHMQVQNAAQAGAQYAAQKGFTATSIQNVVAAATNFSGVIASPAPTQYCGCPSAGGVSIVGCTSTCADGSTAGTYVSVSAQGTYTPLMNYPLIPSSFLITAQSTVRIQ